MKNTAITTTRGGNRQRIYSGEIQIPGKTTRSQAWLASGYRNLPWLIAGLGALLRLLPLGRQSLWLDEALSFWTVYRPFERLLADHLARSHRPLYYLVVYPFALLDGGEWLLRLPSALASIASVGLIYALGRELFDRKTGLLAAWMLALSPLHIWYAQEARMYALVSLLTLASALFLVLGVRRNRLWAWLLAGLFQGLALWTETAAIWYTLATGAALVLGAVWLRREGRLAGFAGSQVLALLIYAPVLPRFFNAMQSDGALWVPPATIIALARTVTDFAGSFQRTPLESRLVLIWMLASGVWMARRLARDSHSRLLLYLYLACWLVLPVAFNFITSQRYVQIPIFSLVLNPNRSTFIMRNLILSSFPLLLLLARGFVLGRRRAAFAFLAALLALNSAAFVGNNLYERKEDYRMAAQVISSQILPEDLVLFAPAYIEGGLAYYYRTPGAVFGTPLPYYKDGVIGGEPGRLYASPLDALEGNSRVALSAAAMGTRVWLVSTGNFFQQDTEGIRDRLDAITRPAATWELEGVEVRLYNLEAVPQAPVLLEGGAR